MSLVCGNVGKSGEITVCTARLCHLLVAMKLRGEGLNLCVERGYVTGGPSQIPNGPIIISVSPVTGGTSRRVYAVF